MSEHIVFSEDYEFGQQETRSVSSQMEERTTAETEGEKEMQRYGTAKPRRIIQKAEIIRD